jgi:integrase
MPEKLEDTHQLLPRKLIVYRRSNSAAWQCRYKIGNRWFASTTKEQDLDAAKDRAQKLLIEAEIRSAADIPVVTKKFRDVAKLTLQTMDQEEQRGKVPVSYKDYRRIINDYLIDFFGNMSISNIDVAVMDKYRGWLGDKLGRTPAYSSMRTHNVCLNKIFEEAVSRRFIKSSEVPKLETKGRKSDKFPTFEVEEVNAILANFPSWIARATSEPKRQQRQMLFDYVRILIDTGARPGKELLDLQWKKIRVKVVDKAEPKRLVDEDGQMHSITHEEDEEGQLEEIFNREYYVFMNVSGKTKERTTNGFEQSFKVLTEIVSRNYAQERTSLKKLTERNDERYVFRTKDGLGPGSFNHVFESFLEEHNLLVDPVTGRNRVFYSLRSTYATTVMNYDAVPIRDLSKQLGNSVGIIQKHYDRATGEAIVENIKAPNAKKALFNTSKVRDIYKSNKVKKSSSSESS